MTMEERLAADRAAEEDALRAGDAATRDAAEKARLAREAAIVDARAAAQVTRENFMAGAALALVFGALALGGAGLLASRGTAGAGRSRRAAARC